MGTESFVGDVEFDSRGRFRSFKATERALIQHKKFGRDLTRLSEEILESCQKSPPLSKWRKIDMLDVFYGAKLPDRPGIYGFMNLRENVDPRKRILYIGKSVKSLRRRVVKQHNKFVPSLRYGATHVCYIYIRDSKVEDSKDYKTVQNTVDITEIYLIQTWAPYLNLHENPFNYQIEPLDFNDNLPLQRASSE